MTGQNFKELQSFDSKLVMASFDLESLFTNIPLQRNNAKKQLTFALKIYLKIGLMLIIC